MTNKEMVLAAHDTLALAQRNGMQSSKPGGDTGWLHLEVMLQDMSAKRSRWAKDKMARWLGWMQAAVVAAGCGTLEDMKQINLRYANAS